MYLAAGNAAALGLGRLTVQSALGENLRAEIDVTSLTPEEEANFRARVAAPDAYRAAGVEYSGVLPGTQVTLERRADGRPYLRIRSDRVVQEPFVDVILELSWASGRLVREYTLLLDPPVTRQAAAPTPPAMSQPTPSAPAARAPAPAPAPSAAPAPSRPATAAAPAPATAAERRPVARTESAPSGASEVDEYTVRRGDTLYGIAGRVQRSGVSLDQMLVSLYRANPQAFIGENMNRLKSGAVLSVPGAEQAQSVSQSEARQFIQAQSADFAAYRQRLAGAVPEAGTSEPSRQASGKVEAAVEDRKAAAAPSPDKLTLSKGGVAAKGPTPEERIAKERERREADTRVAELSRNLDDLKKIAPAASAPAAAPAPAPKTAAPSVQVPVVPPVTPPPAPAPVAPAPVEPPAVASAPAAPAAPSVAEAASAAASAPETMAAASEAASAPAAAPKPKPRPKPPVVAKEEPGIVDQLLDNPIVLPAAGGLIALLLGFGFYRLRSKSKKDSGETSFLESRLQPDSFFGASGGQRIDTKDASGAPSSLSYSLSQLDAIGDVDPVAEADVYLAYGRDLQAEEILKEAMRANPDRLAIRTKLLEVYAKRRDTKGFELLATQLYGLTGGEGEDWAKAQELGRQIDPDNALYQPGGAPAEAKVAEGRAEPLGASTMPQSIMPTPSKFEDPADAGIDLDLDLPLSDTPAPAPMDPDVTKPFTAPPAAELPELDALDFSAPEPAPAPAPAVASAGVQDLDMSFELPEVAAPTPAPAPAPAGGGMEFDLGGISLDLDGVKEAALNFDSPRSQPGALDDLEGLDLAGADAGDPLARKLELAEEFRQIGDREGARELLQEVVTKSSGALKAKAQTMLAELV